LRQTGDKIGGLFSHFSDAAQRIGVYTSQDYINILRSLLVQWDIEHINGINDSAEKARDYLMKLPDRLQRLTDRIKIPEKQFEFRWIGI